MTQRTVEYDKLPADDALFLAVAARDDAAVTEALERGADVSSRYLGVVPLLFSAIAAIAPNTPRTVRLNGGEDAGLLHTQPQSFQTRLGESAVGTRILRRLIRAKASVVLCTDDENGNTPLHIAAAYNVNPTAVQMLLAAGADMNARNKSGVRPIDVARRYDFRRVACALVRAGADTMGLDEAWVQAVSETRLARE